MGMPRRPRIREEQLHGFKHFKLLTPILDGRADVVYGSRFVGGSEHRVLYFWHYIGNKFLTLFSNPE